MPVIVRDLDRDEAIIIMVDTNIQRENISPIEKAKALKMKLEAIKRQGARTDLTSTQVAQKLSVEKVGDEAGISKDQVRRYVRLTELSPELQKMVDDKKIAMTPAVEIFLSETGGTGPSGGDHGERTGHSLPLPGPADEENEPGGETGRGHHAVRHVGAEKAGG